MRTLLRIIISLLLACSMVLACATQAIAFGAFYVGGTDAKLFNKSSQVIIARNGDRTILTIANDFQGAVDDFAMVVPIPVAIKKEQVRIGKRSTIAKLDAFSQPRLVEHFDRDPCAPPNNEGSKLIADYIKQNFKFIIAKVNLTKNKSGERLLPPLQIAYESPKFMLPIRLGTINARGERDLILYVLSPANRVQVNNYRMVDIPVSEDVPTYIKHEFRNFYKFVFQRVYEKEEQKVAFLEYAGEASNCDDCSIVPLTPAELKAAGVFWLKDSNSVKRPKSDTSNNVFITRLHVRYTSDKFPEDLILQDSGYGNNFQTAYAVNHPFKGNLNCAAGQKYRLSLRPRLEKEAESLADLTGWSLHDIYSKIDLPIDDDRIPFWQAIWGNK